MTAYRELLARLDGLRTAGVELGLGRVSLALQRLGSPERRFPAIQIAGTNGKGSTAAIAESILRAAGLRTGLFTSPHLNRFTERIQIGGVESDGERLAELDRQVVATGVPLTYFEVSTALAFLLMAEERVDVAVLETGLGGRLDAVTTCLPVATAITSIAFDHSEYLGTTLKEIAAEKAGIIKPGIPVYLGRLPAEADEVIAGVAGDTNVKTPVFRLGRDFFPLDVPALPGPHQRNNGAVAVELAKAAAAALGRPALITPAVITQGLQRVTWPGRLERIGDDLILDCAHNVEGAAALAASLSTVPTLRRPGGRAALVISVVRGKDVRGMLDCLLPLFDVVVATATRNPRALPAEELAALILAASDGRSRISIEADPMRAIAEARRSLLNAGDPLIVVAGSVFLVGEVRAFLLGQSVDPTLVSDPV